MMFGGYGNGWGIGAWVVMGLIMLLFWGGVVTLVVLLLRKTQSTNGTNPLQPPHHDAQRILDERLARGEIDVDEYTARRTALRHSE